MSTRASESFTDPKTEEDSSPESSSENYTPESNSSHKKPISERKIQANRNNSRRSTGPRTERGKRAASRNAVKYGFFAREVVITDGNGAESVEEFRELGQTLWEHYLPVGIVEQFLVEKILSCCWRGARVLRCENGEIRKQTDSFAMEQIHRNSDKVNRALTLAMTETSPYRPRNPTDQKMSTMERLSATQAAQRDLQEHASGLFYLRELLEMAKSEIVSNGHLSKKVATKIYLAYNLQNLLLVIAASALEAPSAKKTEPEPSTKKAEPAPSTTKAEPAPSTDVRNKQTDNDRAVFLALIDHELAVISAREECVEEREERELDAESRRLSLPPADVIDKLDRHEAHLERQLYRAMDQLEGLQRQRKGENVPPPFKIKLE